MHQIELKPRAIKDLTGIAKPEARKIVENVMGLAHGLIGDIKRLTNVTPECRMRVGDYRVSFEVEEGTKVVYRIEKKLIDRGEIMELHLQIIEKDGRKEFVVLMKNSKLSKK